VCVRARACVRVCQHSTKAVITAIFIWSASDILRVSCLIGRGGSELMNSC